MIVKAKNPTIPVIPNRTEITAVLDKLALSSDRTFDEIRDELLATNGINLGAVPDGHIHQIAIDNGYEIE